MRRVSHPFVCVAQVICEWTQLQKRTGSEVLENFEDVDSFLSGAAPVATSLSPLHPGFSQCLFAGDSEYTVADMVDMELEMVDAWTADGACKLPRHFNPRKKPRSL